MVECGLIGYFVIIQKIYKIVWVNHTKMKENPAIKELFYNYPTKEWHFEQLIKESRLSRAQTNAWVKKLKNTNLIKKIKLKGKMPFYIANYEHPNYQNSKRLYALNQLHESGLLNYLSSFPATVIIFGSFSRWDWYQNSDIDIFLYGNTKDIYVGKFKSKLNRKIQIFSGQNQQDLKKMGPALLKNIIKGTTIKGNIPLEVYHAAI